MHFAGLCGTLKTHHARAVLPISDGGTLPYIFMVVVLMNKDLSGGDCSRRSRQLRSSCGRGR